MGKVWVWWNMQNSISIHRSTGAWAECLPSGMRADCWDFYCIFNVLGMRSRSGTAPRLVTLGSKCGRRLLEVFPWGLALLLWELPRTTAFFSIQKRKSPQSPFMVRKSQTGFIYRGNTEHRGRSHSICKMGPGDRAFSSAFWRLGARGERPVIVG